MSLFKTPVLEWYGKSRTKTYTLNATGTVTIESEKENADGFSIKKLFKTAFLPHGYPDTVSKDYLQYQIYDTIQAFASSITGSVCTHSILKGSGVGAANASALAATITWLYKDGVSMIGKITFTWFKGTSLDVDCKKWRLFADILNDVAMFIDLVSPYFQNFFTVLVCISGGFKSIVGVAGGCTRAAITQHQAIKNNMADVSAKDSSQETLVNFVALLCSLLILPIVTESSQLTWILYFMMTGIHLTANYMAAKSVVISTFNAARFKIFTDDFLKKAINKAIKGQKEFKLLTIVEVNEKENVFFDCLKEPFKVRFGVSFEKIFDGKDCKEVLYMYDLYKEKNFWLSVHGKCSSSVLVTVALKRWATPVDLLEAFFQALVLKQFIDLEPCDMLDAHCFKSLQLNSRRYVSRHFEVFLQKLKSQGFNTEAVLFKSDLWNAEW